MRFARTYFLSALVANDGEFMKGVNFINNDPDEKTIELTQAKPCENGLKSQRNT